MIETSVFFIWIFLFNFPQIHSLVHQNLSDDIRLNTTSGRFQGKELLVENVSIQQFFGIPYGEKPERFQKSILRKYDPRPIIQATNRTTTAACIQSSGGLSYGPFDLPDLYDEDCLKLNIFRPKISSSDKPKAIMVFCHGGSNQVGSGSLFDGSAVAAIGDVIVITINYRLNILGFLTQNPDVMLGNYGLHDQLLALRWILLNAENFHGDSKRITYVGHSAGAANAMLLAMSKYSNGLIARVIAQSGCPLNQWAIDRNPNIRFNHVLEQNGMKIKEKFLQENLEQLKNLSANKFQYKNQSAFDILPEYPFPVIDNDLISSNIEETIRRGSLTNIDILIGVTADESLYFAKEHIFNHYLPKKYRPKYNSFLTYSSKLKTNSTKSFLASLTNLFSHLKKSQYIKNYLQTNYPEYVCFSDEIQARFIPEKNHQQNSTAIVQGYTNLVSDLMFYYDLVRFLHERLESNTSASTYVYYYTNPPIFPFENFYRRIPNMVGHFAELDLIWGMPFFNRSNSNSILKKNLFYIPEEIELSRQMIRYWTNFVKFGNPNDKKTLSIHWPIYEKTNKSFINFHIDQIKIENAFFEERFQFWQLLKYRQQCKPFRWYHTSLLIGIFILTLLLIFIYIFYNTKRSRRNIKPVDSTSDHIRTAYQNLPTVVI